MAKNKKLKDKAKDYWWVPLAILALIGIFYFGSTFFGGAPTNPSDETTDVTTFSGACFKSGESLPWLPADLWIPDEDKDFDPTNDEHLRPDALADYWEREENGQELEDISIDVSEIDYLYLVVDPNNDTVFSTNYHLIYTGNVNQERQITAYHLSSNVFFSNNKRDDGTAGVPTADGNYSVVITDFPLHYGLDWDNKHVGTDWETKTSEYEDFSVTRKLEYNDESLYCTQAALYDPTADTDKDYDDGGELYTEVFAYKLNANATISSTDGSGTQINCTVDTSNVDVLITGAYIYFAVTSEVIAPGFSIDYEISFGTNITISNMYSGRLTYPDDDESGLSFSAHAFSI